MSERRTIWVKPSCFVPEYEMIIAVPADRDELLAGIISPEFYNNIEWDFVDGIS